MPRRQIFPFRVGLALVAALSSLLSGCATNPATGGTQLMLISEQQEIAIGRDEDRKISQSMGLYDDADLQDYIQRLGSTLSRSSERPDLPWSFKVIDDPVVNAFALPGGYIYVTRGLLGHLGSEAQLVTVVGHEIGHVTARHSASQISKAQLASIGLGVGMVLEPALQGFSDLLQTGAGLMFLKFSRDDERQADDLGLRYGSRGGWDMREAPRVHSTLKQVSEMSQRGRVPGWLSTHPEPENRIGRIEERLAGMGADWQGTKIERQSYLKRLQGLVWGENPREGFFEEQRFLHPDLEFQIDFPAGWQGVNQKESVGAISEAKDALIALTLSDQPDPESAAREFARKSGVQASQPQRGRINGLPASWLGFDATSGQTAVRGRVAFVQHGGRLYSILGYAISDRWPDHSSAISESLQSFSRLEDPAVLAVQPARLEIIELDRAMTLEEFQNAYPSTVSLERIAVANQVEAQARFSRGDLVKRVVGGRPVRD